MALEQRQPWDGITERRKQQAPLGVTALNIAARAANDGATAVGEIFTETEASTDRIVREVDLHNAPLKGRVGAILDAAKVERQLTPEETKETLIAFKTRFNSPEGMKLHEGVVYDRVEKSIIEQPEALWSINRMLKAGHVPDAYDNDEEGFDIGTCSKESPESGRNCVYDEAAAKELLARDPNAVFNGSAEQMAEAMGISLMEPDKYKNALQKKDKFDLRTWSYLKTDAARRKAGLALCGNRYLADVSVNENYAVNHGGGRAWRGSLRVKWATA